MTEKRFYLLNYNNYPIYDSLNDVEYNAQFKAQREKLCLLLNELAEEKKELQVQCNLLREQANEFHRGARENANRVRQLEKENKTLKSALKELKEIGDYQEMRIRELSDETNM